LVVSRDQIGAVLLTAGDALRHLAARQAGIQGGAKDLESRGVHGALQEVEKGLADKALVDAADHCLGGGRGTAAAGVLYGDAHRVPSRRSEGVTADHGK